MANSIEVVVSKQALDGLDELYKNLDKSHKKIIEISKQQIDFAGGTSVKGLADFNAKMKEAVTLNTQLAKENEKLVANLSKLEAGQNKVTASSKKLEQQSVKESNARNSLNNQRTKEIANNEKLASAYNQLSQKESESARRVQDLIARGKTATQTQAQYNRELRNAQREFTAYRTKVLQADAAVGRWNRTGERSIGFMRNLAGAFGLVGGVTLFASITREIFQTTKELQSLDNALMQVSGTQEQMARSQAFLRDVSEAYGLEINGLTKQFTQFYVSAKDKLSATQIENIFRSISKAGATMGLSVESQERAFLALNQMMSKGTIQAEELRGQLGEALPGAFGIMAKAVGVTEVELGKLMKDGRLMADEVLPKFARELEKVYGIETINRVETLTASQNRLSNSWTEFVRSLNESETGGISQFFKFIIDGLDGIAKMLIRVNTSWEDLWGQAGKKGAEAGKKFFQENIALTSSSIKLSEKEKTAIRGRIDEIKQMLKFGYNDPKLKDELTELYRKLNPSEGQAESLGNLAVKNIDVFTNKIDLLKKKLQEIESNKVSNTLKRVFGFGSGARDVKSDLEKSEFDLAYWKQVRELSENYGKAIDEVAEKEINLTKAKKAKVKIQKEEEQLIFGTEAWLRKQISLLEETRSKTVTTTAAYKEIGGGIAFYSKWLETLIGNQKKSNEETSKTLKHGTIEYYQALQAELKQLQDTDVINNEDFENFQRQIDFYQVLIDAIRGTKEETKELKEEQNDYFESFIDTFSDNSGFSKMFDILRGNIKDFGKDAQTTALAVSEAFQQAFNTISESSQANFEAEYNRLEMQKENAILFAGKGATAKEEIERQYEQKRKEIARRKAESDRKLAVFNIIIDTAQAVVAALPNYVLAAVIGVFGAAQAAMVSSQPIPAFWKGGEHDGGLMLVNDGKGSNYKETIVNPDGKIERPTGRNVLMNRKKGTKIYTHDQWNDVINSSLKNAGIQPMRSVVDNFAENNSLTTNDFNAGISKLAKTMQGNKGSNTQVFLNNKRIDTDYFKGERV